MGEDILTIVSYSAIAGVVIIITGSLLGRVICWWQNRGEYNQVVRQGYRDPLQRDHKITLDVNVNFEPKDAMEKYFKPFPDSWGNGKLDKNTVDYMLARFGKLRKK